MAQSLALDVYRVTEHFLSGARFGLIAQLRRSSASETEYQLMLSRDLGFLGPQPYTDLHGRVSEVKKMLGSFHVRLTANS